MRIKIFKFVWFCICIFIITNFSVIDKEYKETKEGIKHFDNKDYPNAYQKFENSLLLNLNNPLNFFNRGVALAKQKKNDEAIVSFNNVLQHKDANSDLRAKTEYNLGNIKASQQNYSEAIEHYKNSLKLKPDFYNAKYNLQYIQKLLQQQQKSNKSDKNKDNKNNQNDNKNNNNNNENDNKKNNQQQNKSEQQKQKNNKDDLSKEQAEQLLQSIKDANKPNAKNNKQLKIIDGLNEKQW